MPVIRDILKINQIARNSRHFEGKSIFTTFLCLSPYVRIQKLGWEIYDFFPWPPCQRGPPCQKFPWEIFDYAQTPAPLLGNFPKLYLVINYEGFPGLSLNSPFIVPMPSFNFIFLVLQYFLKVVSGTFFSFFYKRQYDHWFFIVSNVYICDKT